MANPNFDLLDVVGVPYLFNIGFLVLFVTLVLPALLLSYLVVKWSRRCWLSFVKWKHPHCTFVVENSIRSILDQGRNQGIYTLLVQGSSITDNLRRHLVQLSSSITCMRMSLTTKWGLYAWENLEEFSVDNHLLISPCSFKGRAITESNIQEYVSDVTQKFLPSNHSPWQVLVINCFMRGVENQFCLVRVHHLLLRQENLTLADFLPLKFSQENWICQETDSPFTNLYSEPSALPRLHQKLTESFSNTWNEFLCNNDPMERPEIFKKQIGLLLCVKIGVLVMVSTMKVLTRNYRKVEGLRITEILPVLQREARVRNFTLRVVSNAFLTSLNPLQFSRFVISWIWYLVVTLSLKMPILILRELKALKSHHKHYYPDTLTSVLSCYLPLIFQAALELFSITAKVVEAPKAIIEELFLKHAQNNLLQISPCGRKVVAWSEEVSTEILSKISSVTGANETEILLTATVDSLKEYFRHSGLEIPEEVLATAKFVSQRALFVQNHEARGLVCLALPTRTPLFEDDLIEILQKILSCILRGILKEEYKGVQRVNIKKDWAEIGCRIFLRNDSNVIYKQ
ncbi:uncharacterized protein LOC117175944 isoform X2 [Belonocnema kinseyi]|uniref:uncharacterized protein LOC117175944 isoform X2 n=1 Tax=Belonocnema kinseyi TaxID=2817044 RepID=UPI00143D8084|nr:uncharacterized protein LOC117175944 isoform X2 [Belonocnema kinseyi]